MKPGRFHQPRRALVPVIGRGVIRRELGELAGGIGRTTHRREHRRLVQTEGHRGIGTIRAKRQMTGALLEITDEFCRAHVKVPAPRARHGVICRGREQRMNELDLPIRMHGDNPGFLCCGQRAGWNGPDIRSRKHRGEQQRVTGLGRKPPDPGESESLKLVWHRQADSGDVVDSPIDQKPRDLERVERITGCGLADPGQ